MRNSLFFGLGRDHSIQLFILGPELGKQSHLECLWRLCATLATVHGHSVVQFMERKVDALANEVIVSAKLRCLDNGRSEMRNRGKGYGPARGGWIDRRSASLVDMLFTLAL